MLNYEKVLGKWLIPKKKIPVREIDNWHNLYNTVRPGVCQNKK